jgi:hypothetical protein
LVEESWLGEGDLHRRAEDSARRYRRHQYRCRCRFAFEVALDDDAAHRVADQYRCLPQLAHHLRQVVGVVIDTEAVQALAAFAAAMTGEVEGMAIEAAVAEPRQEVLAPAGGGGVATMDEKQRRQALAADSRLVQGMDSSQFHGCRQQCMAVCASAPVARR